LLDLCLRRDDMRVVLSKSLLLGKEGDYGEVLLSMKLTAPNPLLIKEGAKRYKKIPQ